MATLADGIELLLKARLEVYDWTLLFKNVDDASRSAFENGDFQSVTFDQAVKRLKGICGVAVESEALIVLNALRKLRNRIRHFAIETDRATASSLLGKTYGFAIDFTTEHLEEHLTDDAQTDLRRLRRLLGEFDEFITERLEQIDAILKSQAYAEHVECPRCLQTTLYPDGGEASCAFCGQKASGEDAAEEWFEHHYGHLSPKDRMCLETQIENCPECGAQACIPKEDVIGFRCFACGESGPYERCNICGALFSEEPNPGHRCDACWNEMMRKD